MEARSSESGEQGTLKRRSRESSSESHVSLLLISKLINHPLEGTLPVKLDLAANRARFGCAYKRQETKLRVRLSSSGGSSAGTPRKNPNEPRVPALALSLDPRLITFLLLSLLPIAELSENKGRRNGAASATRSLPPLLPRENAFTRIIHFALVKILLDALHQKKDISPYKSCSQRYNES